MSMNGRTGSWGARGIGAGALLWGVLAGLPAAKADVPTAASLPDEDSAPDGDAVAGRDAIGDSEAEVVVEPTRVLAANTGGSRKNGPSGQSALAPPSGSAAAEILGRARSSLAQLHRSVAGLDGVTRYAQNQKDAYPASCVSQRRAMGNAVVRLGEQAVAAAEEASRRSDTEEVAYQASRLQLMREKMKSVAAEAYLCVKDDASFIQISRREVQVERGIPNDDPVAAPAR